ncbi:MAG: zinc ABC transporter substrate-binding protein, partial [Chloroflexota bacterium]|nr:zinc ABC transporter substrate-binding protein [Chloroflexota bacterium]
MVGDAVARVGGDRVEVETLMGPGVDPHLYKPSESDVLDIAEADIVLYVGLHLEGRMGEVLERASDTRPVVAVTEEIEKEHS